VLELAVDRTGPDTSQFERRYTRLLYSQFRIYQDAVPGRTIDWVWFIPAKIGPDQLVDQEHGDDSWPEAARVRRIRETLQIDSRSVSLLCLYSFC
jgi:hypothetical protein